MISVQVGQDHRVRGQAPAPEEGRQHAVVISGIKDDDGIPVPEDGRVRAADTELDILCGGMREGAERNGNDRDTERRQGDPDPGAEPEEPAEAGKEQQDARGCQKIGRPGPERNTRNASEPADRRGEAARGQGSGGADRTGKKGHRQAQQREPVQQDQAGGEQQGRHVDQHSQQRQLLEIVQLREQDADLRADGRAESIPQAAADTAGG